MTRFAVSRPLWVLFLSFVLTVVAAAGAAKLEVGTSAESLLTYDAPSYASYQQFRESEGEPVFTGVLVEVEDAYSPETLRRMGELENALMIESPVPILTRSVVGLANLLRPDLFVDGVDEESAAAVRSFVEASPLVESVLVDPDGRWQMIIVEPFGSESASGALTAAESLELAEAVVVVARGHDQVGFATHPIGGHVVNYGVSTAIVSGMSIFLPIAFLVVIMALAWLMRRLGGVLLPMLVVTQALVMTMGISGWLGMPIDAGTQIIPPFLLAVGVADATHLLSKVYRVSGDGRPITDIVVEALGVVRRPIVFTSLTTAAAMSTFSLARADMVRNLGILSAIGVLLALLSTLIVVPAILVLRPPSAKTTKVVTTNWVGRIAEWSARRRWLVIPTFAALTIAMVFAVSNLEIRQNSKDWLPDHDQTMNDHLTADELVGGSFLYRMKVDSGSVDGALSKESLDRILRIREKVSELSYDFEGEEKRLVLLPGLESVVEADGQADSAETISLLQRQGIDTSGIVDATNQVNEITVLAPFVDVLTYDNIGRDLDQILLDEPGIEGDVFGYGYTFGESFSLLLDDMSRSYLLLIGAIALLLILPLGLRAGLASIWPNLLPILAGFAALWLAGGGIDTISLLIAGILAGVAVDDTIHIGSALRRAGRAEPMGEVVNSVAPGVLFATIVLGLGFGTLALSPMPAIRYFGIMAPAGIVVAFLADVMLFPALVTVVTKSKPELATRQAEEPAGDGEPELDGKAPDHLAPAGA